MVMLIDRIDAPKRSRAAPSTNLSRCGTSRTVQPAPSSGVPPPASAARSCWPGAASHQSPSDQSCNVRSAYASAASAASANVDRFRRRYRAVTPDDEATLERAIRVAAERAVDG